MYTVIMGNRVSTVATVTVSVLLPFMVMERFQRGLRICIEGILPV